MAGESTDRTALRIGLNMEVTKHGATILAYLDVAYTERLQAVGCLPLVVPPLATDAEMSAVLDGLNGFVLTGSAYDLDPRRDGFELHPTTRPMHPIREDFDRRLARMIRERRMPVLGIGGGMQLLNVVCGGTISLHIPEDFPRAIQHDTTPRGADKHPLTIESGSLIDHVYRLELTRKAGAERAVVSSAHHQAVDDEAPGFRVTAQSEDGIVEAIESTDRDWLAVGVQWHPEGRGATMIDRLLFEVWADQVRSPAMPADYDSPPREFERQQAADYIGLSYQRLAQLASQHRPPRYILKGCHAIYLQRDLDAFLAARGTDSYVA